jgi:hypothetical protein
LDVRRAGRHRIEVEGEARRSVGRALCADHASPVARYGAAE